MNGHKTWKDWICGKLYCRPGWNRKLVRIKCSLEEVCKVLNAESGPGK